MLILTVCWGKKHIDLFEKTTLKSLMFHQNKEALKGSTWNFFTDDENVQYVESLLKQTEMKYLVSSKKDLRDYIDPVQSATLKMIKACLDLKVPLLLAPPDTIFGNGSVKAMQEAAWEDGSVIVSAHPRVNPSFLSDFSQTTYPVSNPHLVDLAWKHLHKSWTDAEIGHDYQSSYVGGVEWKKLNEGLYAVTHRLPSPYFIKFTEEDLQYFKSAISFGHFDHKWPGDILCPRGRQRYIASSDACFIAEITEADKNVPFIIPNQPKSGFWRDQEKNSHNHLNKQVVAIFRGING